MSVVCGREAQTLKMQRVICMPALLNHVHQGLTPVKLTCIATPTPIYASNCTRIDDQIGSSILHLRVFDVQRLATLLKLVDVYTKIRHGSLFHIRTDV